MLGKLRSSLSQLAKQEVLYRYCSYHRFGAAAHSSRYFLSYPVHRGNALNVVPKRSKRCLFHVTARSEGTQGNFFDAQFWDSTYTSELQPLEWYQSYDELSPFIKKFITTDSRVLMAGCGNSEFSMHMVKDGFKEIVNIDISPVVIEAMRKKYALIPQLKYMRMDATNMSCFENGSFDCVIDKGTLDAIMCVVGGPYNVAMMLAEITRILKSSGVYMLISFAGPYIVLPLLNTDAFGWSIDSYALYRQGPEDSCNRTCSYPVLLNVNDGHVTSSKQRTDSLFIYICRKLH
ncbi:hypothetical protein KP509_04G110800 [Ceratopteris richardii]|uniref:Methyltransferase type 11 domain-containing protein n=1 Tax=Ceratopteris richardii TaxID=49495 RepID=A0A8T2V864_CERRI|nr:hypothetical protein KP509_04G110800 [Ceratopteris richardii]